MIKFHCNLCRVSCTGRDSYQEHMEGSKHRRKQLLEADILHLPEPPAINFCDQDMPNTEANVSDALPSTTAYNCSGKDNFNSLTLDSSYQQASNTDPSTTEPQQFLLNNHFCCLCNIQCTGLLPYQQHVNGKNHAKKVKASKMFSSSVNADTRQNITTNTHTPISSLPANVSSTEAKHAIDHKPVDCTPPDKLYHPIELTIPVNKDSASESDAAKINPLLLSNTANRKVALGEEPQINPTSETHISVTHSSVNKQITTAPRSLSFQNNFPLMNYNCSLCQVVCTSPEQHNMHMSGKLHAKKLKFCNATFLVTNPPVNSVANAFEHALPRQEPPHDQNPTVQMENGVITNLGAVSKPDISESKHDVPDQNSPSFAIKEVNSVEEPIKRCSISDFKNTTSNARCNICDVSISGRESYITHIRGRRHQWKAALYNQLHPDSGASATDISL